MLVCFVLVVVVLIYVAVQVDFRLWRRSRYRALLSGSTLADTDRGTVEYATHGEGPTVLVMHGGCGGYDQALAIGNFLTGFHVVAPSRPGHLRTELTVGQTYEDQARACVALLDSLKIDRVAVLGASGGGPPAIQFAAQHPDRVWALVLVSAITKEFIEPKPELTRLERVTNRVFGKSFMDWFIARAVRLFPERLLLTEDSWCLSAIDREILRQDPDKLQLLVDFVANSGPYSPRMEGYVNDCIQQDRIGEPSLLSISAPTLVIHGTADTEVPLDHAESVARRIQGSELVTVDGAGHYTLLTQSEQNQPLIRQFLHKHAPVSATK